MARLTHERFRLDSLRTVIRRLCLSHRPITSTTATRTDGRRAACRAGQWYWMGRPSISSRTVATARSQPSRGTAPNQTIQARVKPLSFNAPDNWVGLAARYADFNNHYYVERASFEEDRRRHLYDAAERAVQYRNR